MHLRDLQNYSTDVCTEVFGEANMTSQRELDLRFAEEACELLYARGLPFSKLMEIMVHEYFTKPSMGRGAGEIHQEIAGTMVTLLNLAEVAEIDAEEATMMELKRILANKEKIRAKHDAKPHISVRCDEAAA